ncbi:right-handed parallel beta-helix repeat-containing protein [Dyadobacter jiangsuensis]
MEKSLILLTYILVGLGLNIDSFQFQSRLNYCEISQQKTTSKSKIIYVSLNGNDKNNGSIDFPIRDINFALNSHSFTEPTDLTIFIRGGTYEITKSISVNDCKKRNIQSVQIRSYRSEIVKITGGKSIDINSFRNVESNFHLSRLNRDLRVASLNLDSSSLAGLAPVGNYGYGKPKIAPGTEVFIDQRPGVLARWPNNSELTIQRVEHLQGKSNNLRRVQFSPTSQGPQNWGRSRDVRIEGHFSMAWTFDQLAVGKVDLEGGEIEVRDQTPFGLYESNNSARPELSKSKELRSFHFYNVLEETDSPREYFLDIAKKKLYLFPSLGLKKSNVEISLMSEPLLKITKTNNVQLDGIQFSVSRGRAIEIDSSKKIVIVNCDIRNLGLQGIFATNSSDVRIKNCKISNTGAEGIVIGGGVRKLLIPSCNKILNCEITNFSRLFRCYSPGISVKGVGVTISGCLISNGPDQAIVVDGNDHLIQNNRINKVCYDFGDTGAIYCGRNPSATGTVIDNNIFEDIFNRRSSLVSAIYLDDGTCGLKITNNLFYRCGRTSNEFGAIFVHGGWNNFILNNTFIECPIAVSSTPWSDRRWIDSFIRDTSSIRKLTIDVDINAKIFQDSYPHLRNFFDTTNLHVRNNTLSNSLILSVNKLAVGSGLTIHNVAALDAKKKPGILMNGLRRDNIPAKVMNWPEWCGFRKK